MNRTFNEFENSQNNNGPISVVDMENIQNNNAMDYIPNRNEINITIEPAPHSINRNLAEGHRDSSNDMVATTSMHMERSMATMTTASAAATTTTTTASIHENIASGSTFEPYYQMNEFNAYRSDEQLPPQFAGTATASESLNNYIDLEDEDTESPLENDDDLHVWNQENVERIHDDDDELARNNVAIAETICHRTDVPSEFREPISHHKNDEIEHNPADDDAISVEEALRALDFAISGGESILSDYQDSEDSDTDTEDKPHDTVINDAVDVVAVDDNGDDIEKKLQQINADANAQDMKCTELIETVDAKDIIISIVNETEIIAEMPSDIPNDEHSREYVYEVARELVDSVLEECTEKIALVTAEHVTNSSSADSDQPKNESHASVTADNLFVESIASPLHHMEAANGSTVHVTDLDDSMDETFVIGKLEASTPCHKTDINMQRDQMRAGVNLFQTLDEVNESALSDSGIEPLQKTHTETHTQIAYVTFEVQPNDLNLTKTFVKNDDADDDKTFVAPANQPNDLHETFDIAFGEVKPQNQVPRMNPPTIKIDKEEANSDDLTTQTPMNTPIELNYVGESWDQFVSKSMNNKSSDLQEKRVEESPPNTNAISTTSILKNAWFLHAPTPQTNDTFDVNDAEYSNYEAIDDDSESIEENAELLSLTFDALRRQLAESLPQASGI